MTNARTPVIRVAGALPGAKVYFFKDEQFLADAEANADGEASFTDPSPPANGAAAYKTKQYHPAVGGSPESGVLTVNYDTSAPAATINQAAGQADPTTTQPVNFTAAFSEAVYGFQPADVSFAGSSANLSAAGVAVTGGALSFTVSVSNILGPGTILASVPAAAATDAAGNASAAATFTDRQVTYTLPPAASASPNPLTVEKDGSAQITLNGTEADGDDLTFTITDAPDHGALTGQTAAADCSAANTCTLAVTYTPAAGYTGPDSFQFKAGDGAFDSDPVTVNINVADTTPPTVVSVKRAHPNPALPNQTVAFQVAFGEDVTGVDASDFALTRTGANTDSAVTGVTGSGRNYLVTVGTGTGSGTFRLDVLDDDSILDPGGNPLGGAGAGNGGFTAGQSYTVFPTLARGLEIELLAPSNALLTEGFCARNDPAAPASFPIVTLRCTAETGLRMLDFTGATSNHVGEGDYLLTAAKDGTFAQHLVLGSNYGRSHVKSTANLVNSRERMSYDLDADTFFYGTKPINFPRTGEFDITFQFGGWFKYIDGDHFRIQSASGVVMNATVVDLTVPDLLPASDTGASDRDNLTTLNANLQFDLPYAMRAPGQQFDLLRDGAVVSTATSDANADATLTDPGVVPDGAHSYAVRRHSDGGVGTPLVVTVQAPPPAVVSVTRAAPDPVAPGASVSYLVTFSKLVTGVDASDFALTTTGSIAGASVTGVSADAGATRTVTVSTGSGVGTVRLDVVDDNTVRDASNNQLGGPAAGDGNFTGGESFAVGPALAVSDVKTAEGDAGTTVFTFTVTLDTPAPAGGVTFDIATADGTASAGSDYAAKALTGQSVPEGSTSYQLDVQVNGDAAQEAYETFTVSVSNVSGAQIADAQGSGTILNDDGAPAAGQVVISEFRLRGPGAAAAVTRPSSRKGLRAQTLDAPARSGGGETHGASAPDPSANDEFVEVYNSTDSDIVVADRAPSGDDGADGWALVSSDAPHVPKYVIPAGTVIPARGHFLIANGLGYSLSAHAAADAPGGVAATYAADIPDGAGLALLRTGRPLETSADAGDILDRVGFRAPGALFVEGAGLAPEGGVTAAAEHSFVRRAGAGGRPQDTGDNEADFELVSTDGGLFGGRQATLGAPGPENSSSPVERTTRFGAALLDPSQGSAAPPNRVRGFAADPANNSTFGTLLVRRRITNNTGAPVTRLRFRVTAVTGHPRQGADMADVRVRTSADAEVGGVGDEAACAPDPAPCTVTVRGLTLEEPPGQPHGGGVNSALAADAVTLAAPLADGASINVQFLLGLQQTGRFRFYVLIEALP